jgi:high-affinity Fe2+/Pb2+ permease
VNTTAVIAAGAAAAAASQNEEPESTPWGWVAFGILAAGLAGVGIFWLVRRRQDKKPSVP